MIVEKMGEFVKKLNNFLSKELWHIDLSSLNGIKAFFITVIRLTYVTIRESNKNELSLRAMSLVYTTIIAIVPLLAFSFSVLKAFGVVDSQLEPILSNFLAPLGEKGTELTQKILEFINNMKVGVLGSLGLLFLVYTVISLIQKTESSLNYIWGIEKGRSFSRRFTDYLSVILIGPVFIFTALGITATLMSHAIVAKITSIEPFGTAIFFFTGTILPYIIVSAVFTFIYSVMPNTQVKSLSALLGGVVAGICWQSSGWIFASFVASSTQYATIYSGFAVIILFMIWLYISWLIFLIGGEISYCHQNLNFLTLQKEAVTISNRLKEKIAFLIMYLIGYNFYNNKHNFTLVSLAQKFEIPEEHIQESLTYLMNKKLIIETTNDPPSYVPAKDLETIKLYEIIEAVRENEEDSIMIEEKFIKMPAVDMVAKKVNDAIYDALGEENLRNVITSQDDKPSI
ncbi:MAG: YihY/virulence factor BrkB family protein [Thermodesulfobacteriota bacterium]